ncbi:MAG: hypothetical protein BRC33_03475 [Cyanobacteria bacterium SW_9_44_58]|nr:MAG: hypothetical protein BRC33_03475 [Cyanobacteria bacterium SW_9_44_58]
MLHSLFQKLPKWSLATSIALLCPLSASFPKPAWANPAHTAPESLTRQLNALETAANNGDLEAVQAAYSDEATTVAGSPQTLTQKLKQFWDQYSNLDYQVELQSWEKQGNAIVAETVTKIRGSRNQQQRNITLQAELRSRQRFVDGKIVSQEILNEQSRLYIGENAPRVKINAPNEVKVGEQFSFDVIVREPLGEGILLGTAIEENVKPSNYLKPQKFDLKILPAGGIYRLGKIKNPGKRWLSAIIVRENGMTLLSKRVNIVPAQAALSNSKNN